VDTDRIIEFSNGCICCNINGDVQQALNTLEKRASSLDVVCIETSGVCEVGPIVDTLRRAVGEAWRLDGVLCVIDAATCGPVEKMSQADLVVANKIDGCADPADTLKRIKEACPEIPVVATTYGRIDVNLLLLKHDSTRPIIETSEHAEMHTWTYERDRPFCPLAFEEIVWPSNIARAKGFIWLDGCPQCVVFHLCGRRSNPFETIASLGMPCKSIIVFVQTDKNEADIGEKLDAALLKR